MIALNDQQDKEFGRLKELLLTSTSIKEINYYSDQINTLLDEAEINGSDKKRFTVAQEDHLDYYKDKMLNAVNLKEINYYYDKYMNLIDEYEKVTN